MALSFSPRLERHWGLRVTIRPFCHLAVLCQMGRMWRVALRLVTASGSETGHDLHFPGGPYRMLSSIPEPVSKVVAKTDGRKARSTRAGRRALRKMNRLCCWGSWMSLLLSLTWRGESKLLVGCRRWCPNPSSELVLQLIEVTCGDRALLLT